MSGVFTPRDADTDERLTFDKDSITVIEGDFLGHQPGSSALIEIDGVRYRYEAAPCGAPCFCDATIRRA